MNTGKIIDTLSTPITHPFATLAVTSLASVAGGVYLGYCSAKGTPTNLESVLTYGPAVAQGTFGFLSTALFVGMMYKTDSTVKGLAVLAGVSTLGGALSAGMGALETGVGYCIGYTLGSVN